MKRIHIKTAIYAILLATLIIPAGYSAEIEGVAFKTRLLTEKTTLELKGAGLLR